MDNLFALIRRPRKEIILCILFGGYIFFSFLENIGTGGLGSIGGIFSFLVSLCLLAGLIVSLFIGNENASKILGAAVFAYFVITMLVGFLPNCMNALGGGAWYSVLVGIFGLFAFFSLLGAMAFYVLGLFMPIRTKFAASLLLTRILMLVFLGSALMVFLFYLIALANVSAGWGSHMGNISMLFVLVGIFYGYFIAIDR